MFTGIISTVGTVTTLQETGGSRRLRLAAVDLRMQNISLGDSISVSGVCLTVVAIHNDGFTADVSKESLDKTILGDLAKGDRVNLEPALTLSQPLGGHLVTGHVDGVGEVMSATDDGDYRRLEISVPDRLARYVARKGSVCVDGVSLTVNEVEGNVFGVMIVPHTLQQTTIASYGSGHRVNIEVDMIARYLERILQYTDSPGSTERTE